MTCFHCDRQDGEYGWEIHPCMKCGFRTCIRCAQWKEEKDQLVQWDCPDCQDGQDDNSAYDNWVDNETKRMIEEGM